MEHSQEMCFGFHSPINSTNHIKICYLSNLQNQSILIWFTVENLLTNIFDSYRFILRSIHDFLSSTIIVRKLTNFTELIDVNNSLRILNLDPGQYEICIEFHMNSTKFIYQPRDGCLPIRVGKSSFESLKSNPAPLFIALTVGIVIFFILGLVVQTLKVRRRRKHQDNDKTRSRSSSNTSTRSFKQQCDRLISLFHRYIDRPYASHMRTWARDVTLRHRISTKQQIFKANDPVQQTNTHLMIRIDPTKSRSPITSRHRRLLSEPTLSTNHIYTISNKVHDHALRRKVSFNLTLPEEYEMT